MKAIMMSIRPQHVAKILNGEKTIEIRKKFPKDYVGWVYIYLTKDRKQCLVRNNINKTYHLDTCYWDEFESNLNGKVVARFWCDKVEEIKYHFGYYDMGEWAESYILENSCLSAEELDDYLQASKEYDETKVSRVYGYAIHITKLEIFNKPKEIGEFRRYCDKHFNWWTIRCLDCKAYTPDTDIEDYCNENKLVLTRAPESWCYVEI